jgi:NAD(P)-dependent dehydrogenase (short-subunit alcohol dehydrogenase family)
MARWTADEIPDLSGRTAVVTGGNSGIGYHTALELARHGARVVVASRSADKGRAAVKQIKEATSGAGVVEWAGLDLADLSSVRDFAAHVDGSIDLLVNNAGVMMVPRQQTVDGFELQFGTNHLGHFALTGLLLPALLAASSGAPPRVVTVSSGEHHKGTMNFDDLMGEQSYGQMRAYQQSKLANLLFTFELQRRADAAGVDLLSVAAHPGFAATNLGRSGNPLMALGVRIAQLAAQPAAQGALPTLYAATAPDVRGAEYFGPDGRGEQRGYPQRVRASVAAQDEAAAKRLWETSEELTGVRYEALASR